MRIPEKKKVLLVMEMEHQKFMKDQLNMDPETYHIFQSYGPILSPFSDYMRDILITVYKENIDEIKVVRAKNNQKTKEALFKSVLENEELRGKMKIMNYLLENCQPEFSGGNIYNWITGSNKDDGSKSVDIIRNHPLLPSNIKVQEICIDKEELVGQETSLEGIF
jgi:carbonic anhydrase